MNPKDLPSRMILFLTDDFRVDQFMATDCPFLAIRLGKDGNQIYLDNDVAERLIAAMTRAMAEKVA